MSVIFQLIAAIVLVGLGVFIWRAWKRENEQASALDGKTPSVSEAGIEQVRVEGLIQLPPHGEEMTSPDVQVKARHVYEEDGFQWFELEGDSATGTVWLEVCHDDALETSVTLKKLTLDDVGLTAEAVPQLGKGSDKLSCDGRQFSFSEHGRARFFRGGDRSHAENIEYWDFEGDDDKHDLGIENWDGEFRVYLSQRIDPARIRIYSLGAVS